MFLSNIPGLTLNSWCNKRISGPHVHPDSLSCLLARRPPTSSHIHAFPQAPGLSSLSSCSLDLFLILLLSHLHTRFPVFLSIHCLAASWPNHSIFHFSPHQHLCLYRTHRVWHLVYRQTVHRIQAETGGPCLHQVGLSCPGVTAASPGLAFSCG